MSYCLNPKCLNPADPLHEYHRICRHCGSVLELQERYRVQRLLGEGGFGKTYAVIDRQDVVKPTKVLKVLSSTNRKAIELFKREAEVLQRLHHPGIPKVATDGYFIFRGRNQKFELHCLVMEFIAGENLEQWMSDRHNRPITETQTIEWLKQLADILQQVHQQNYFHRDIKPSNIMRRLDLPANHPVNQRENPVDQLTLIDFGSVRQVSGTYLAKVAGGGAQVTGIISPGYTPPEQVNGKAVPQSDFYALGRTFVYLLTGKEPNEFAEDPRTGELQWRSQAPQISNPLADLIDYMMSPFPGNRPQNTYVISQRLEEIQRYLNSGQYPGQYSGQYAGVSQAQFRRQLRQRGHNSRHSFPVKPALNLLIPSWVIPYSLSKRNPRHRKSHRRSRRRTLVRYAPKFFMGMMAFMMPLTALQLLNELDLQSLIFPPTSPSANSPVDEVVKSRPVNALPLQTLLSDEFRKTPTHSQKDFVLTQTLAGHLWGVNAVDISPDAKVIVSGSVDKTVKIWEIATGSLLHNLETHSQEVWSVATSPDGKMLASGGGDGNITLWEMTTGYWLRSLESQASWVMSVAFSPDGKTLASGSRNGQITLWNVENDPTGFPKGVQLRQLYGHTNQVLSLAYSSRSPILVSSSYDGTIKVWDVSTGALLRTLEDHPQPIRALAISPDGEKIASGSDDGTLNIWNLNTGELILVIKAHSDAVRSLAFGQDGQTVITGGGALDSRIKVWDAKTGARLQILLGHSDTVNSIRISPDGKILTSGSEDNTIRVWRILSPSEQNSLER